MSTLIKRTATGFLILLVIVGAIALNSLSFVALFFLIITERVGNYDLTLTVVLVARSDSKGMNDGVIDNPINKD